MLALLIIALLVLFCWYVLPIIAIVFVLAVVLGFGGLMLGMLLHKMWKAAAGK